MGMLGRHVIAKEKKDAKAKKRQSALPHSIKDGRIPIKILHCRWEIVKENYLGTYNLLNQ